MYVLPLKRLANGSTRFARYSALWWQLWLGLNLRSRVSCVDWRNPHCPRNPILAIKITGQSPEAFRCKYSWLLSRWDAVTLSQLHAKRGIVQSAPRVKYKWAIQCHLVKPEESRGREEKSVHLREERMAVGRIQRQAVCRYPEIKNTRNANGQEGSR